MKLLHEKYTNKVILRLPTGYLDASMLLQGSTILLGPLSLSYWYLTIIRIPSAK